MSYYIVNGSSESDVRSGNKMSTTEAYCYERYHQLKKKICDKLGVPYYVQLDLDWMLTTYFHQSQDKKEIKIN